MGLFDFLSDKNPKTKPIPSFEDWFKDVLSKHLPVQPPDNDITDDNWLGSAFNALSYPSPTFNWHNFENNNLESFITPGIIEDAYLSILKQLEDTQSELLNVIEKDEKLYLITPLLPGYSERNLSLKGLAIITDKRFFIFKNKIIVQLKYSEIVDIKHLGEIDGTPRTEDLIGLIGGGGVSGVYCPVILIHTETLPKMPLEDYFLDETAKTLMKEPGSDLMILTSNQTLRNEFITTLKKIKLDKSKNHTANKQPPDIRSKTLNPLLSLIDDYIKIMKGNFVIQDRGELVDPRQDQIDIDKKIISFIKEARKAGNHKIISEAQIHLSATTKGLPEYQANMIEMYGKKIFGTLFKDAKRETLEDMIDNIVKAWSAPIIFIISDEELQKLNDELTEAALTAIKAGNQDALSKAHKHLFMDSTTKNLDPKTRLNLERFLPAALAGKKI